MTIQTTVENEVMEAYADCWLGWEEGSKRRNLSFMAGDLVSRDEAIEIMRKAVPNGYNDFNADYLYHFDPESKFQIAREGSVCVYVRGGKLPRHIHADEVDTKNGITRIWWD